MRVELISPRYEEIYGIVKEAVGIDPPLGISYIASYLENHSINVGITDAQAENLSVKQTVTKIKKSSPDVVGINTATATMPDVYRLAEAIKELDNEVLVIVGGPHATALPTKTLEESKIDIAVRREGEETMLELVKTMENGGSLSKVAGISYKEKDKVAHTQDRRAIENLDSLPFPARHLLPMDKYSPAGYFAPKESRYTTMIATRGCQYKCIFCGQSTTFKGVRRRTPSNVLDEIEEVVQKYGVEYLEFMDSTFVSFPKLVKKICEGIIERNIDIKWSATGRVNLMTKDLLQAMKRAGCKRIYFGVESGNQHILELMRKRTTLDQIRKSIRLTRDAGISSIASFILGMPTETKETIEKTIQFAIDLEPDFATFSLATPFPGTEFYDIATDEGYDLTDWAKYKLARYGEPIYHPEGVSLDELKEMYSNVYKRFYFRPRHVFKKICGIRSLTELRHNIRITKSLLSP